MPRDDYTAQFNRALREYEKTARKWQKSRERYWKKFGSRPYVAGGRPGDMTFAQRALTDTQRYFSHGNPISAYKPPEKIRNRAEAERLTARMKEEMTPGYHRNRQTNLRADLTNRAAMLNARRLLGVMAAITDSELMQVYEQSDFADLLYLPGSDEDIDPNLEQTLIDTIRSVLAVNGSRAEQRISRREQKLAELERRESETRARAREQNRRLVAQGGSRTAIEKRLKSFGIRPDGAPVDWYRDYESFI